MGISSDKPARTHISYIKSSDGSSRMRERVSIGSNNRVRVIASKRTSVVKEEQYSISSQTDSHHMKQVHVEIRKKTTHGDVKVRQPADPSKRISTSMVTGAKRGKPTFASSCAKHGESKATLDQSVSGNTQ